MNLNKLIHSLQKAVTATLCTKTTLKVHVLDLEQVKDHPRHIPKGCEDI